MSYDSDCFTVKRVPQAAPETNITFEFCEPALNHFLLLPTDVVTHVASFLSPAETDGPLKATCKLLLEVTNSIPLWKEYCCMTGKLAKNENGILAECSFQNNPYKDLYYSCPCVPLDYETVSEALKHCPSGKYITLLPGIYFEQILIHQSGKNVTIRAAFPEAGAALAYYDESSNPEPRPGHRSTTNCNQPCIRISGIGTSVTMINVQILHSSCGSDIWGGNCAIHVDSCATLTINNCDLQSDSGRGVVVTSGAIFHALHCNIHDCAATGLYVGDAQTAATIVSSNIIRNGSGSRRRKHGQLPEVQSDDLEHIFSDEGIFHPSINLAFPIEQAIDMNQVPPGHSGMYVESGAALVHDCMLSGNSLTGLSVVRGGRVQLSGCDATQNGTEPITVEDVHVDFAEFNGDGIFDVRTQQFFENTRGGIFAGVSANNFESVQEDDVNQHPQNKNCILIHGSRVRHFNPAFIHSIYRPVSEWEFA